MRAHLEKLTRESLVYGTGQAVSRGLQMALVPVFTRVFVPAEYGVVDLIGLVSAIAVFLIVMGTDGALARFFYEAEDREARRTMVSTSAAWRVGMCALLAGSVWLLAPVFSRLVLASPSYAKYVRLAAATFPFTAFVYFQNDVLRVTFQPWKFIALNIANTVVVALLSILFVVGWHRGVSGVLYGKLAGDAISAGLGFVLIRHMVVRRADRIFLRRMLAYGLPLIPAAVAYWAINYADRWVLVHFADLAAVGVYAVAVKLGTIMVLIVSAFQLAWGPFAFAHAREPGAGRLFARVLVLYVGVASAAALVLGLFAPEALAWALPPAYVPAAVPGALLAFAAVAYGAYYITGLGVNLSLRTEAIAWTSLAAAAVTVVLALLLVRPLGLFGVALATLAGFTCSSVLLYLWSQRVHPIPYRGVRALCVFATAIGAWALGSLGARTLGEAGTPGAGLALRVGVVALYLGLVALLARRIPDGPPAPVARPGDATIPPAFPVDAP